MRETDIVGLARSGRRGWQLYFPVLQTERRVRFENRELNYLLSLPSPELLELEKQIDEEECYEASDHDIDFPYFCSPFSGDSYTD